MFSFTSFWQELAGRVCRKMGRRWGESDAQMVRCSRRSWGRKYHGPTPNRTPRVPMLCHLLLSVNSACYASLRLSLAPLPSAGSGVLSIGPNYRSLILITWKAISIHSNHIHIRESGTQVVIPLSYCITLILHSSQDRLQLLTPSRELAPSHLAYVEDL